MGTVYMIQSKERHAINAGNVQMYIDKFSMFLGICLISLLGLLVSIPTQFILVKEIRKAYIVKRRYIYAYIEHSCVFALLYLF